MASTHSCANLQGFIHANIKTFVYTDNDANRLLTRLWKDFEVCKGRFDKLIDIISNGKLICSASDGSVLSDRRALAGCLFWRLTEKFDNDIIVEKISHFSFYFGPFCVASPISSRCDTCGRYLSCVWACDGYAIMCKYLLLPD